eukprot:7317773-Pyramimonas_sp.AAC.1
MNSPVAEIRSAPAAAVAVSVAVAMDPTTLGNLPEATRSELALPAVTPSSTEFPEGSSALSFTPTFRVSTARDLVQTGDLKYTVTYQASGGDPLYDGQEWTALEVRSANRHTLH